MNIIIHESQIFSPIPVFGNYITADVVWIEQYENYQKRSFRNRYQILSAQGPLTLSIPLAKGKNNQLPIKEVCISYDEPWVSKHLQAIKSAYGKSPYFEYYFTDIEKILASRYQYLFELNRDVMEFLIKKLKLQVTTGYTSTYHNIYPDMNDIRDKDWAAIDHCVSYTQVWTGKFDFVPNLSILDLLFCSGPESISILSKMSNLSSIKY
ncbi:MAG: WbqC family protein [Saprospiraceae bacterium]|nr:WbqC family protein [Saprospiraceae bacterium]MBK8669943.1 WbqC family protein [Saprospiraceae bacterium]MBL0100330.1 WbqC family protein [Saprospiraceae bacterium]